MGRTLADLEDALGGDALAERVRSAEADALALDRVLERVRAGSSRSAAIREIFPDRPVPTMLTRLRVYEAGGLEALVSRRFPPPAPRKMTEKLRAGLEALAKTDRTAGAETLAKRLGVAFNVDVSVSCVNEALRELGLAHPRGRPTWREAVPSVAERVESLGVAGAELLKAVDLDCGAVAALTEAVGAHVARLPEPNGPVDDDRGGRNERGRFLPAYNAPKQRLQVDLGHRFNSVAERRTVKDLRAMRVAEDSAEVRHRKDLALVLLPVVVRGTRWSALEHWRGGYLEELVGVSYQASTLDKYLRELKFSGAADACREAVASYWLEREGPRADEATGAVVTYADTATKPLWTRHWTRSTRVSRTGRVMPATSTLTLHSGAGTPLIYRSFSGYVSLAGEIVRTLELYERHAGEGTARRVVVMDREAHAAWLFRLLDTKKWGFIVPLRSSVVGASAQFEDEGPWQAYGDQGDEVRDAQLWINDKQAGERRRIRVVARRRHRTGKVAWFAMNVPADEIPAVHAIRLYFERWPAQEHVYRDGAGAVGLEVHHGYGKRKVDNVVVLDRLERLEGQIRKHEAASERHDDRATELRGRLGGLREALDRATPQVRQDREALDTAIGNESAERLRKRLRSLEAWEAWGAKTQEKMDRLEQQIRKAERDATDNRDATTKKREEILRLADRRQIYTVDVELDEIMTAYKLTFMNLGHILMRDHLGIDLELETLIDGVLSLPGERATTKTTETVRIYRQPRDPRLMAAVESACASLTARGLRRDDRVLRFELVEPPPRVRSVDRTDPRP